MVKFEKHSLCEIFDYVSRNSENEYLHLKRQTAEEGPHPSKVTLFEGKVIDGWYQYRAVSEILETERQLKECDDAWIIQGVVQSPLGLRGEFVRGDDVDLTLEFVELDESPIKLVIDNQLPKSANSSRRAATAVEINDYLDDSKSSSELAKLAGVSIGLIKQAESLLNVQNNYFLTTVSNGGFSIRAALKEVKDLRFRQSNPVMFTEKQLGKIRDDINDPDYKSTEIESHQNSPMRLSPTFAMGSLMSNVDYLFKEVLSDVNKDKIKEVRKDFLRNFHPDKTDLSDLTPTEQSCWNSAIFDTHQKALERGMDKTRRISIYSHSQWVHNGFNEDFTVELSEKFLKRWISIQDNCEIKSDRKLWNILVTQMVQAFLLNLIEAVKWADIRKEINAAL